MAQTHVAARRAATSSWIALIAVAAGTAAAAFAEPDEQPVDVRRERMLFDARESEAQMAASGQLYGDAALDAYLQSVMERLYPEFRGHARVRAIHGTDANAFSDALGNVYVYIGLLPRLRDESELAAVLGHEGGHIQEDHVYRRMLDRQAQARDNAITRAAWYAATGINVRVTTLQGFARATESAADRDAVERLKAAGYEAAAAPRVFLRLAAEGSARGIKEVSDAYADHPRDLDRAADLAALAAAIPGGERREPAYAAATAPARSAALHAIHEQRDGLALVALLEEDARARDAADGEFLLGEGYRLRGAPDDGRRALEHYNRSIAEHPEIAAAFAARARIHERDGNAGAAIADLERFLALAPGSREAPFARQALDRLRRPTP